MTCRGICERYRSPRQRYDVGVRRCTACDIYIDYVEKTCPCCGTVLRTKRKAKYRH